MLTIPEVPLCNPPLAKEAGLIFSTNVRVSLNGKPCQVRSCRESAFPFNRVWPGVQRQCDQTEMAAFVAFSSDEAVRVTVEMDAAPSEAAVVRPLAKHVTPLAKGNSLEFMLKEPGQYVLENGSWHSPLYLFFDPLPDASKDVSAKWHFGPGVHFPGLIRLSSGDSVYIDPAAIVFGCIYGKDVQDVRIFGGGTLHGGMMGRVFGSFCEDFQPSSLKFYNSSRINISGIIVQDSPCWTTSFFGCSHVNVERVKIVGQWRYNNDGIDICNSDHVRVINSFVRSFDDGIVLKGIDHLKLTSVEWAEGRSVTDIEVRGCVLWSGWGRTLEVGIETGCPEYDRILFEECDLIHNSAVCLDIQNGNYADAHGIVFRNIRIEYQADTLPEVYQKDDRMKYDGGGVLGVPALLVVDNRRYGGQSGAFGDIHDILFEDVSVFAEAGVPQLLPVRFANHSSSASLGDITIRNLTVNGVKILSPGNVDCSVTGSVGRINWE